MQCSHLQLDKIPFLTLSMERLSACPQAAEWEIRFPHGVICLSGSTLNGLPSPASKSFLCVLALPIPSRFFPPWMPGSSFMLFTPQLLNHNLLNHPSASYIWNTFHFHAAVATSSVSAANSAHRSEQGVLARSSPAAYREHHRQHSSAPETPFCLTALSTPLATGCWRFPAALHVCSHYRTLST